MSRIGLFCLNHYVCSLAVLGGCTCELALHVRPCRTDEYDDDDDDDYKIQKAMV